MHRFFVNRSQVNDAEVVITGADVNHIRNVLRMKPGDVFLAACGDEWEYTCRIESVEQDQVLAKIEDAQMPGKELRSQIFLFQCLPKSDKMDLIVQKAVELGAYAVVPVQAERSVVRYDAKKAAKRVERWNAIAESAAKQAKRMIIPQVTEIQSFSELFSFAEAQEIRVCLMPYELAENMGETRQLLDSIRPGERIGVLIGPEGGFAPSEAEQAIAHGFHSITLGKRILRTETAGLAALSILMYLLEDA